MAVNLDLDKTRLGPSEAGDILGCGFRTAWEVAALHKDLIERDPPTDEMQWGKLLERALVDIYSQQTGRFVEFVDQTYLHPEWKYLRATPDALCRDVACGVEAKYVNPFQAREWGDTAEEMPLRVQLQILLYMEFFNLPAWDVIAFIGGRPSIFTMLRDPDAGYAARTVLETFWRRYIIGDEMPPMGASDAAARWLQQTFPRHRRPDIVRADSAQADLLDDYLTVRVKQKILAEQRAEMENKLKLAIGEHEGLEWEDGVFTWRKTKDGTVTDWQSMALGLMNQYVTDPEMRKDVTALYTHPKPGARRILLTSEQLRDALEAA